MDYRQLGNTGIEVSKICLGTMNFGQQNSEADAHDQMDYAVDQGVNFFDSAELYAIPPTPETQGLSERYVGSWLKARGNRKDLVIATKIVGPAEFSQHVRQDAEYTAKSIHEAVENSLKRLQTDYIDLYQLHWPARKTNFFGNRGYRHFDDWEDNFHEILIAVDALVKSGKIRHFGLSNETPWGITHFLNIAKEHNLPRIVSVQNPYNLLNRLYEVGSAEISIREQVGLLAYSPLAFGLLSGKYHDGTATEESRINKYARMSRYSNDNCHRAVEMYIEVAKKHGHSLTQMALAFINQQPFLTANIIGATTLTQLKENIESAKLTLSADCIKDINQVQELISNPAP